MRRFGHFAPNLLLALLLACQAFAAVGATLLYLDSDVGDPIGAGAQRTLTPVDGTITARESTWADGTTAVQVEFRRIDLYYATWTLQFRPATGETLRPGNYQRAGRFAFASPVLPGLDVSGNSRGCNTVTGHFTVREVQFDDAGGVTRLAIDFVQHCDGATPALRGAVRINSELPVVVGPIALAGSRQSAMESTPVAADGTQSYGLGSSIASYAWRQVSGPAVVLANAGEAIVRFNAPDVPAGGGDVVLELRVTDSLGLESTDTTTVHVLDVADARSVLWLDGAYAFTRTGPVLLTSDDGAFALEWSSSNAIVRYQGTDWFTLVFGPGAAEKLHPGTYAGTLPLWQSPYPHPVLDVQGNGSSASGPGSFVVRDVEYGTDDRLIRLAIDFQQNCTAAGPPLFGAVRVNSAVPLPTQPLVCASVPARLQQGTTVALDAEASLDPRHRVLDFTWIQTAGPAVPLRDPNTPRATFVVPVVGAAGADLEFQVTVTNDAGTAAVATLTTHVVGTAEPTSKLYVHSQIEDPVGGGGTWSLDEFDGTFTASGGGSYQGDVVVVTFTGPTPESSWTVELAGNGTTGALQPGDYVTPADSYAAPRLHVSRSGYGCSQPTGRFTVLEAVYTTTGVDRFAADFEQNCGKATLFGAIRFNTTVAILPRPPKANIDAPSYIEGEAPFVLDARRSLDPQDDALSYRWRQTAGPGARIVDATTIRTEVHPIGSSAADLEFELEITNAHGLVGTATARVHVRQAAEQRTVVQVDRSSAGTRTTGRFSDADSVVSSYQGSGYFSTQFTRDTSSVQVVFNPPVGRSWAPGYYEDLPAFATATSPSAALWTDGPWCSPSNVSLHVIAVELTNEQVTSFAADLAIHCGNDSSVLFGSFRYHSAVPFTPAPTTSLAIPTWNTGQSIGLGLAGGGASCGFAYARALRPPPGGGDVPPTLPAAGVQFPYGMVVFQTTGCRPGVPVTIAVKMPDALPAGTIYWKYGPTPQDRTPHWYSIAAQISGDTATFSIVDGALGDDDLAANGAILDAGGPGVSAVGGPASGDPGAGGGVAAAPRPDAISVPVLAPSAIAALALILGFLAMARLRRC